MRTAFLAPAPVITDGWGRYVRELVPALAAREIEITLIVSQDAPSDPDLPVSAYHRILPAIVRAPRLLSSRLLAAIPRVWQLTAGCDVVHIAAEPYALATLGIPRPAVVTAHGTYLPQTAARPLVGALYRAVYRRATIIAVSGYTSRRVQKVLPGLRGVVIPNGVDASRYRERPPVLPATGRPTVLAVGQIKPRKGFHILAQAIPSVRAAIPDARFVFVGDPGADPAYTAAIRETLISSGQSDAVLWAGRAPDETLRGWFHAAQVFALPAVNIGDRFEGFGLVYLEASAAGLPVVGTFDCGAEDAIRNGETGLLVPQNDPQALAEALIRLLSDPDLRAVMGSAGAAFAEQHTWAHAADSLIEVYRALCQAR